jgi:hypothetical protein
MSKAKQAWGGRPKRAFRVGLQTRQNINPTRLLPSPVRRRVKSGMRGISGIMAMEQRLATDIDGRTTERSRTRVLAEQLGKESDPSDQARSWPRFLASPLGLVLSLVVVLAALVMADRVMSHGYRLTAQWGPNGRVELAPPQGR